MEFVGQESARDRRSEEKRTAPATRATTGTPAAAGSAQIIAFPGARATRGRRRFWTMLRRWTHTAWSRSGTQPQGLRAYRPADSPADAEAKASEN